MEDPLINHHQMALFNDNLSLDDPNPYFGQIGIDCSILSLKLIVFLQCFFKWCYKQNY